VLSCSYLSEILKQRLAVADLQVSMGEAAFGGDIHSSFSVNLRGDAALPSALFVKCNSGVGIDVLKTEFESLTLMNESIPSYYPQAVLFDDSEDEAVLIMSFHDLESLGRLNSSDAGRTLALQHNNAHEQFGWPSDNYIGMTPQSNQWTDSWVVFFREQRLLPVLAKAKRAGLSNASVLKVSDVINNLDEFLSHHVVPSLVHGDLWSGNLGFDRVASRPLFYDPAPYFGDREVDIAMTRLFGCQSDAFYQGYEEVWPLESGHEKRRAIYNLYHALNHVVLFGGSYNGLVDECLGRVSI